MAAGRVGATGLEAKGAPRVVEAVRVREPRVAASGAVLRVAGLHPEDVLGDASLRGDREAAQKATVSTPIMRSAAVTIAETQAGEGTGSG